MAIFLDMCAFSVKKKKTKVVALQGKLYAFVQLGFPLCISMWAYDTYDIFVNMRPCQGHYTQKSPLRTQPISAFKRRIYIYVWGPKYWKPYAGNNTILILWPRGEDPGMAKNRIRDSVPHTQENSMNTIKWIFWVILKASFIVFILLVLDVLCKP